MRRSERTQDNETMTMTCLTCSLVLEQGIHGLEESLQAKSKPQYGRTRKMEFESRACSHFECA